MVNDANKPSIFLDRDGVVVKTHIRAKKPFAVNNINDFVILPGVKEAIKELKRLGFLVIIVTNQPDISKGLIKIATINKMHEMLMSQLALDDIKLCPHLSEDKCNCRKPNPGMLLEAAKEYSINLKNSYMIGDRVSDIKAGEKAGCKCIFIDHGYAETESENFEINMIVKSLPEAVNLIKNSEN